MVSGTSNVYGTGLINSTGTLAALNVLAGGTANITGGTVGATTSAATLNLTGGNLTSLAVTAGTSNISGGSVTVNNGAIFASAAGSSLVISFAAPSGSSMGVMGVGGDFRFFDQYGMPVDGRIWVRLGNGTSVMRNFTAAEPFVGFWSDDASSPILSLRIQPISNLGTTTFVGLDSLYLATVPAPGSVAVLAAVAMTRSRRRC